jgi:hypothetical protein
MMNGKLLCTGNGARMCATAIQSCSNPLATIFYCIKNFKRQGARRECEVVLEDEDIESAIAGIVGAVLHRTLS